MCKVEWNFVQSYAAVSSDGLPILYSVDLWSLSHSVFQWAVKFFLPCLQQAVRLPSLFQSICEVLSILCCSILWWSSTLCFSELWSFYSSPVLLRCEVLLILCSELWSSFICCSSQLCSFSHSVFQWAVEPGFICQYFNMQGKKQPVCLSVCLSVCDGGNMLCALIMESGKDWMNCYEWYEVVSLYMHGGTEEVPNYVNCMVHTV
jgi:hypothetical protein